MNKNSDLIHLPIESVKEGMHVVSIDIPWSNTDFTFQDFKLNDESIVHLSDRGCKFVSVSKKRSKEGLFVDIPEASVLNTNIVKIKNTFLYDLSNKLLNIFDFILPSRQPVFNPSIIYENPTITHADKRQQVHSSRKAHVVRKRIAHDQLVDKEIVTHAVTSSLSKEYKVAVDVNKQVSSFVKDVLFDDIEESNSIRYIVDDTKKTVSDIAASMIRNPDAMHLIDNVKLRNEFSYKHALDVCVLMVAFGREMCFSEEVIVELGIGGLLHDIGEPKPLYSNIKLRDIASYSIYKEEHVANGLAILKNKGFSRIVETMVEQHHERCDGSGYPNNLFHKEISTYALMLGIVDTYVSLKSGRLIKNMYTSNQALKYIKDNANILFDGGLCDVFFQMIGVYPVGSYVELDTNEIALVIKQNKSWKLLPVIQIMSDKNRKKINPFFIDLLNQTGPIKRKIKGEALKISE